MASLGDDLLKIVNKLQDLVFNTIGNDSLDLPQIVRDPSQLLQSMHMPRLKHRRDSDPSPPPSRYKIGWNKKADSPLSVTAGCCWLAVGRKVLGT